MVTGRKRTVLTPEPAPKAKAEEPARPEVWNAPPGRAYRAKPRKAGLEPIYSDVRAEAEVAAEMFAEEGIAADVERYVRGSGYCRASREPVLVADLVKLGLARPIVTNGQTRFQISPEGQRMIDEAMGL